MDDDLRIDSPRLAVAGRVLFGQVFLLAGITHFTEMARYVAAMHPAIPFRPFWVATSAVVELAGATMIVANWRPRLGGWLIFLFLVPVTIVVHGVGMVTNPDAYLRIVHRSFFLKGFAMAGAALLVTQLGVVPQSPNRSR
jgi:putative oxidoreductase